MHIGAAYYVQTTNFESIKKRLIFIFTALVLYFTSEFLTEAAAIFKS